MKQIKILLFCMIGLIALSACSDDDEEEYKKFPAPEWNIDNAGEYPVSMTAVVVIPDKMNAAASDADQMAAFIGDDCRGIGEAVDINGKRVYFILIKGNGAEQEKISFRYYGARNAYMYSTPPFLGFEADTRYGSPDEPKILPLEIMQE